MKIQLQQGSIQDYDADTIVVNLFEDTDSPSGATGAVDSALDGAILEVITSGDLKGKEGEVVALYTRGAIPAKRVLVVGLGDREDFDLDVVRRASAAAILKARSLGAKQVASVVHGAGIGGLQATAACQATVEGAMLAAYRYAYHKEDDDKNEIDSLTIVEYDENKLDAFTSGMKIAQAIAEGVYLARNLVNMPPNVATPSKLAEVAEEIAHAHQFKVTIGDRQWAAEREMGAFLAVAKGAGEPPKFVVLEHNSDKEDLPTIVLVGKGITFDTGGISIKPSQRMWLMKSDMAGAAAVLGTMKTVGLLDLPLRVIGITPCTENMPDANAYRPADVVKASNGKTIEVLNTDAEGRMVLADGLVYATSFEPDVVIDLATLTGASVVALGQGMAAGLFSNNKMLEEKLLSAANITHERLWPLPLGMTTKRLLIPMSQI